MAQDPLSITRFSDIRFDKATHTYTLNGRGLPSVTELIGRLKQPFDSAYWAQRKAQERGVGVETILAEWEQKRQDGLQRGMDVHEYIADALKGAPKAPPMTPYAVSTPRLPEMDAFDDLYRHLAAVRHLSCDLSEWIVGDADLGVAGTVDAVFSTAGDKWQVWDWKTGGKFRCENRFQCLLPPFDDLDECELTVYSLQVSLYRLIIERNTGSELEESAIAHLTEWGQYVVYDALDLRGRAEEWLKSMEEVTR